MKLVYIWVEGFRNIGKLDFNVSGEFEVSRSKNNFYISKRRTFISDFFGQNVSNVTALIGRNGTGKSNILDFICTTLIKGKRKEVYGTKYLYLFEEDGKFYRYSNSAFDRSAQRIQFIQDEKEIIISTLAEPSTIWDCIFYSNVADNRRLSFIGNETINLSFEENQKNQANKIKYLNYIFKKKLHSEITDLTPLEKLIDFDKLCFRLSFDFFPSQSAVQFELIRDRYKTAYSAKDTVSRFSYYLTAALLEYLFRYYVEESVFKEPFELLFKNIETLQTNDGLVAEKIASLKDKVKRFLTMCEQHFDSTFPIPQKDFSEFIVLLSRLE